MTKAAVVPPPTPTDKEVDVEIQEIEDGGNEVTGGRSGGEEQSSFSSLEAASSESEEVRGSGNVSIGGKLWKFFTTFYA